MMSYENITQTSTLSGWLRSITYRKKIQNKIEEKRMKKKKNKNWGEIYN